MPSAHEEHVRLIYEGVLEPRPWLQFLKALRAHLNLSHANIAFHRKYVPGQWFDSVVDTEGELADLADEYLNKYAAIDPTPYQELVPERWYTRSELWRPDHVFYRDYLRPRGLHEAVICLVEEPGGMRAWLTLGRRGDIEFSAEELATLSALIPHFSSSLRIYAALHSASLERDIYKDTLRSFAVGILLIDRSGCIIRTDSTASRILERNDCVSVQRGRLCAKDRTIDRELKNILTQAVEEANVPSPTYSRALRLAEKGQLSVLVRSVAPDAASANEHAAVVVAFLSDTHLEHTASVQRLIDLFQLSPTEAALTLQIAQGHTLSEAAHVLNLSEQTARTYSKHVFAKTGTHRQAELVRLILRSVAQLAM